MGGCAPHVFALLLGGLGTSLGATFWARSRRGADLLAGASGRTFAAAMAAAAFAGPAAAYAIVRSLVVEPASDLLAVSPGLTLLLGIAVGLPMGVPGVIAGRSEATRRRRERKKWRDHVPTKDDRRAYAASLVKQIRELSPTPRELTAGIGGDGGTILRFEGDIAADEGEKLTRALREDLADVGFKRVEGANGSKEWWSRV